MKKASTDVVHSKATDAVTPAELRAWLADAPLTECTKKAEDYVRLVETYTKLVITMLGHGCNDSTTPTAQKPTWLQRLRLALESGKFKPPNAAALLNDLDRAQVGDRGAQERIIDYLNLPGVMEAFND